MCDLYKTEIEFFSVNSFEFVSHLLLLPVLFIFALVFYCVKLISYTLKLSLRTERKVVE